MEDIFIKATRKLNAQSNIILWIFQEEKFLWMDFFKSQLYKSQYSPLIWVCCNHYQNYKIVWLHDRLLKLMMKTFKYGIKFFSDNSSHEVWQSSCSHIPLGNTMSGGTENIWFLGPKFSELVPNDIKYLENLKDFKTASKTI